MCVYTKQTHIHIYSYMLLSYVRRVLFILPLFSLNRSYCFTLLVISVHRNVCLRPHRLPFRQRKLSAIANLILFVCCTLSSLINRSSTTLHSTTVLFVLHLIQVAALQLSVVLRKLRLLSLAYIRLGVYIHVNKYIFIYIHIYMYLLLASWQSFVYFACIACENHSN